MNLRASIAALALLAALACKNSNTTDVCDNGVGGVTQTSCAEWAAQGSCESFAISQDAGTSQLTCAGQGTVTFYDTCCMLTNCKDTSFLTTDSGLPLDVTFPSPQCTGGDGGADASGD